MTDVKQWYYSKTVWGALLAILASMLQAGGIEFDTLAQQELADSLVALTGAVGGIVAIYGRVTADKKVG